MSLWDAKDSPLRITSQKGITTKMKIPLIVIDMQTRYASACQPFLLKKVIQHIETAKKSHAPILIVEFRRYGKTRPEIMRLLTDYDNYQMVSKKLCDGSIPIQQMLEEKWCIKAPCPLKICGIYTHGCIAETAKGLVKEGFSVKVIEEACLALPPVHNRQIETWEKNGEVQVIYKRKTPIEKLFPNYESSE